MRFRIKVETSVLPCILLLGSILSATAQQAQSKGTSVAGGKPNIVFILVDNVGWSNFQVYGGTVGWRNSMIRNFRCDSHVRGAGDTGIFKRADQVAFQRTMPG